MDRNDEIVLERLSRRVRERAESDPIEEYVRPAWPTPRHMAHLFGIYFGLSLLGGAVFFIGVVVWVFPVYVAAFVVGCVCWANSRALWRLTGRARAALFSFRNELIHH